MEVPPQSILIQKHIMETFLSKQSQLQKFKNKFKIENYQREVFLQNTIVNIFYFIMK